MNTDQKRRLFLKYLLVNSISTATLCAGVITPRLVLASWPRSAFKATSIPDILKSLYDNDETTNKKYATEVKARPHLDDGGTKVTVSITTSIADIESITLIAANNQTPLVATFQFGGGQVQSLATRIKMEDKGEVIAIIKSGNRLYSEATEVDFSGCGCG